MKRDRCFFSGEKTSFHHFLSCILAKFFVTENGISERKIKFPKPLFKMAKVKKPPRALYKFFIQDSKVSGKQVTWMLLTSSAYHRQMADVGELSPLKGLFAGMKYSTRTPWVL